MTFKLPRAVLTPGLTASCALLVSAVGCPAQSSSLARSSAAASHDVIYGTANGEDLKLDIYQPVRTAAKAAPVAVYIHGGGWRAGDKSRLESAIAVPELLKRGYVVASVNYRLAPANKWPAQIEDCRAAVRYLCANAATFHADPARIVVWGDSAGAHLAALVGLAGPQAGWDKSGGNPDEPFKVSAVVDMFGPADLTGKFEGDLPLELAAQVFNATKKTDEVLRTASPVTYVEKNSPPFLILQGTDDNIVPAHQSQELYEKLKAAGVPATLIMVKNAGHAFTPTGGQPDPSLPELARKIADFFDKSLKK